MRSILVLKWLIIFCGCIAVAGTVQAATRDVRVPLHDGKLHTPDLTAALCREMHLPAYSLAGGDIDVSGLGGSLFVRGVNASLGDGCKITVERDAVVVHLNSDKWPANADEAHRAIRVFTANIAPDATARQAKHWGLMLPEPLDDQHPLVVLIHGLDTSWGELSELGRLLKGAGYQVAYFCYADGQPLADSSRNLAEHMAPLRQQHPNLKIDMIGHSMGGLVARDYVEGDNYHGGVEHLILIATPNAGSKLASAEILLKVRRQFDQAKSDPDWNWTWGITNGLGESARDLQPNSPFLTHLNALPRRSGVKYTVIVGDRTVARRIGGDAAEAAAKSLVQKTEGWWSCHRCAIGLQNAATRMRNAEGTNDGLINVDSAKLSGVDDVVVLPADHATLVWPDHGNPPAAWPAILDRLRNDKR